MDQDTPHQDQQETATVILPRIKANYSHEIYQSSDKGMRHLGNKPSGDFELPLDQQPILMPLYEDLTLGFVIDEGNQYSFLQNQVLDANPGLTTDTLYQMALNGLVGEVGDQLSMHGTYDTYMGVAAGGNFEAALILLDDFWRQMHEHFGGDLVLAIPANDLLLITRSDNREYVDKIKSTVNDLFHNPETTGLLSKALYLREQGNPTLKLLEVAF